MSRWFRHYAGMMRDDKLVRVALKSKQTVERVTWVWGAILESAAEIDDGGRYEIDHAEIAYFLRADEEHIAAIESALGDLGRLHEGSVAKWASRQFQSDKSAERTKRYRDRHKGGSNGHEGMGEQSRDGGVTAEERHGDTPETETETDTETNKEGATAPSSGAVAKVDYDLIEKQCREAAGLEDATSPGLMIIGPILRLVEAGASMDRDILPVLRAAKAKGSKPSTWTYFLPAIERAMKPPEAIKLVQPPFVAGAAMVFVPVGTEAFDAWNDHKGKKHPFKYYPDHGAEGWLFPSEFPPGYEAYAERERNAA